VDALTRGAALPALRQYAVAVGVTVRTGRRRGDDGKLSLLIHASGQRPLLAPNCSTRLRSASLPIRSCLGHPPQETYHHHLLLLGGHWQRWQHPLGPQLGLVARRGRRGAARPRNRVEAAMEAWLRLRIPVRGTAAEDLRWPLRCKAYCVHYNRRIPASSHLNVVSVETVCRGSS
jgi:hypothetical protein